MMERGRRGADRSVSGAPVLACEWGPALPTKSRPGRHLGSPTTTEPTPPGGTTSMAKDHKRSAYTQDQDFGGDDLRARIHECQAATHARADELAGRPPSEKQKKHAAKGRLFRRSAWQHRRVENLRKRPKAPVEPLLHAARTSARAGEAGGPGAKRAAGIRSGTDPGDDSDQPSPARACLRCGRDLSHRRSDAKTCGTTCRKQVERHGP